MSRKAGSISIREKKRRRAGYSLIAPACLVLLVIFFVPLIYAFAISISDSDAIINNSFRFVGLKNYFSVMTNSKFLAALGHTCFFVITTITLEFIIGFVVALLLYREVAGSRVFRLIFAVPLMVAPVVSGLQWRWLFADQYGIINALLNKLGFEAPLWIYSGFHILGNYYCGKSLAGYAICYPCTAGRPWRIVRRTERSVIY